MTTTNFVDKTTVVEASWLNDVDAHVYDQSTGLHTAANIANVPAGGISATNVQTAVNELDTEKINNSVLTTRGDIIRRGASAPERLALGTRGSIPYSDGTDITYLTLGAQGSVPISNGTDLVYAPQTFSFKNKIIGGDFTTNPWQRGTTFTAPANAQVTADCWRLSYLMDGVVDILKTADAPTAAQANYYATHCLHADVTTADAAIAAGQYYIIRQNIEGLNIASFGCGQAGARTFTLSFWHKHTKTGTYCVAFNNSAANRSYVAEYSQAVTDTWEKTTITVPVDTAGTWLYDTGVGMQVSFVVASGSTYHTTAGAWTAGNYVATSNQVNALDSTSNNFKLALVQLEAGTVATPFEARDVGTELALCRRYLPAFNSDSASNRFLATGQCVGTTNARIVWRFTVPPRTAPTGLSVSNATHFGVTGAGGSGIAATNVILGSLAANNTACDIDVTVSSGLVAGNASNFYSSNSSAQLLFTGAEL